MLMTADEPRIDRLAWLEGAWTGSAFGGTIDEVFAAPAGGVVLATSRVVTDGQLTNREFIVLADPGEAQILSKATLAAVALFLWRRPLIAPLLGIAISGPLTESFPLIGLPALTAPFVLATWIVLALGKLESACLNTAAPLSE